MIELIALNYLAEQLDVPVLMELPEVPSEDYPTYPDQFVIIQRIGSTKANLVTNASLAFQSYSLSSLYDAATLDEQVREAVESMVELDSIGGVHLASNYNFTDTQTKRYRYQCVYEIYYV